MSDVVVKDSSIHGKGLYAARVFQKGEVVLTWQNARKLSPDELMNLPESEHSYVAFLDGQHVLMGKPERYVNHSCDPNTTPGNRCDIAKRVIKIGEEITTDYADFLSPESSMICSCGSKLCHHIVEGKKAPLASQ
ncbi:MAG: SET domain-containing protein-lysine N-methyltransferase [Alphaproteobacteria bacterium]|nr:SET domain-containing protein-lysine N-methyltransferase [Alphaproteobacteria bacterium]